MTPFNFLIVGTGYTGIEFARLATTRGYAVVGTTRSDTTIQSLRDLGAEAVRWSLSDGFRRLAGHLNEHTVVIYSIPTLFKTYDDTDDPPRHVKPVQQLVEICESTGIERFLYLSSTSVYGDHGGDWVDEDTKPRPNSPYGQMRRDIETFLMDTDAGFPINIARLAGIYGPGRTLAKYLRARRYILVDEAKKVTNRVHVQDIARALLALAERGPNKNRIFNVADGLPQPIRDLIDFVCTARSLPQPPRQTLEQYKDQTDDPNRIARKSNSLRVLSDRLRRELEFSFDYPDVFSGYKAIFEAQEQSQKTHDSRSSR